MPLTPAHAAAALPVLVLARRLRVTLPLSALVIGTLTPDFEYLFRLRPHGEIGHSALGLITFCLPIGIGAWLLFRALIVPALLRLLPPDLATALEADVTAPSGAPMVLSTALAVLLGAMTHTIWDSFTHHSGWSVSQFPVLGTSVAPGLLPGLRWYTLSQHASTIVGLAIVVIAVARWIGRQRPAARRFNATQASRSIGMAAIFLCAATIGGIANAARGLASTPQQALGLAAVGSMAALAVALLAYALAAWLYRVAPRR